MKKIILLLILSAFILKAEEDIFTLIYPIDTGDLIHTKDDKGNVASVLDYIISEYPKKEIIEKGLIEYNDAFFNKILGQDDFYYKNILDLDYSFLASNVLFEDEKCLVYGDYDKRSIFYYSLDKNKIIEDIEYDKIREFYGSDKYFAVFNEDYEFDIYEINSADKEFTIEPEKIITGDNLLIDKYFVMNHESGFTIYDLETEEVIMEYKIPNIKGNRIFQKNDSTFYFITTEALYLVNFIDKKVEYLLYFYRFNAHKIFLDKKNMNIAYIQNDNKIIYYDILAKTKTTYNLEYANNFNVFALSENGLIIGKYDEIYQLSKDTNGNSQLKYLKKLSFKHEKESFAGDKLPGVDLSKLSKNVKYPKSARYAGIEGRIEVTGLYSKDGLVVSMFVLDKESKLNFFKSAANALLKTDIEPAYQNGKPIKCYITIPVKYRMK